MCIPRTQKVLKYLASLIYHTHQMQKVQAKSYGVIPVFKDKDGFHILLVKNSKGGHWGLPKGTPEKKRRTH